MSDESPFRPEHFRKYDESDDARFYVESRFVAHIDDTAIAALSEYYAQVLKPEDRVLDLMSSWISHLPAGYQPARAVGLGMNADELSRNPALDDWVVHDLNREPTLPFDDGSFDAVLIAVSVQYLQASAGGIRGDRSGARAGRPLCGLVLEPLLPDQGGGTLAGSQRFRARAGGGRLLPARRRLRRPPNGSSARRPAQTPSTSCRRGRLLRGKTWFIRGRLGSGRHTH